MIHPNLRRDEGKIMRKRARLYNIFVLECVTCKNVEQRETKDVTEQPFCEKCYMPMITKSVILNSKVFPVARP